MDTRELRGKWQFEDGAEGGELYFTHEVDAVRLFDATAPDGVLLPARVLLEIERAGFKVEESHCDNE